VPLRVTMTLGSLKPGPYECQVNVLAPGAKKAAFWRTSIYVVP
jgi:hypothetical protein